MPIPIDIGNVAALELVAAIESVSDASPAVSQPSGPAVLSGRMGAWDFPTITVPF